MSSKIRNVGPKSAAWLRQIGVRSTEDLIRVGPVEAFLKVKRAGFRPSLNLLYAMAGAMADCHWAELPEERKQELLAALEAAESANPIRTRWEKAAAAAIHVRIARTAKRVECMAHLKRISRSKGGDLETAQSQADNNSATAGKLQSGSGGLLNPQQHAASAPGGEFH